MANSESPTRRTPRPPIATQKRSQTLTKKTARSLVDLGALMGKDDWKKSLIDVSAKESLFQQGEDAGAIYFLQEGHVKLTVLSRNGKEATIGLLSAGDFLGEEVVSGEVGIRLLSATALTDVKAYKISRTEMLRMLMSRPDFSSFFMKFLLAKSARTQADLIDQLFNSSERRLARVLLLMAAYGQPGEPSPMLPSITQGTLAEMIGTTRGRVSFFMNRFRKLGFIEYNGRIKVHRSLLNLVLHDDMPGDHTSKPGLGHHPNRTKKATQGNKPPPRKLSRPESAVEGASRSRSSARKTKFTVPRTELT